MFLKLVLIISSIQITIPLFHEFLIIISDSICWIMDTIIFMVICRLRRGLIVNLVSNCSSGRLCTLSLGAGLQTRHRRRQYNNIILNIARSPDGEEGGIYTNRTVYNIIQVVPKLLGFFIRTGWNNIYNVRQLH